MGQKYVEKKIGHLACLRVNDFFSDYLSLIGNLLGPGHVRAVSAH